VLLIASRKTVLDSLQQMVAELDCRTLLARNRRTALRHARQEMPDLIVLDDSSERVRSDALSVTLRRVIDVPILLLVREETRLQRFAHTHALKRPFSSSQLQASVRDALDYPRRIVEGSLTLDLRQRTVISTLADNEAQRLTPKLFALLRYFMHHPGQTVSRNELMRHVWQTTFMEDTRTLDVHIRWLRELIEANPSKPKLLQTVRGVGYRLNV